METQLAHRCRTELTSISIAAQLLARDDNATERQQRLANDVLAACRRLEDCLDEWQSLPAPTDSAFASET